MSNEREAMKMEQASLEDRLQAFLEVVIQEAGTNPSFRQRLQGAFEGGTASTTAQENRSGPRRRAAPRLDPFAMYEQGENQLRESLSGMNIDELKDIVAGYGFDRARLALKWRRAERLVDLIVDTVKNRTHKGDAFRT